MQSKPGKNGTFNIPGAQVLIPVRHLLNTTAWLFCGQSQVAQCGIQREMPKNTQPGTSQKNQHRVAIFKKFDDLKCNRIQRLDTALWIPRLRHRRHRSRSIADLWKEIKFEPAAVEQKLLRHWPCGAPPGLSQSLTRGEYWSAIVAYHMLPRIIKNTARLPHTFEVINFPIQIDHHDSHFPNEFFL